MECMAVASRLKLRALFVGKQKHAKQQPKQVDRNMQKIPYTYKVPRCVAWHVQYRKVKPLNIAHARCRRIYCRRNLTSVFFLLTSSSSMRRESRHRSKSRQRLQKEQITSGNTKLTHGSLNWPSAENCRTPTSASACFLKFSTCLETKR